MTIVRASPSISHPPQRSRHAGQFSSPRMSSAVTAGAGGVAVRACGDRLPLGFVAQRHPQRELSSGWQRQQGLGCSRFARQFQPGRSLCQNPIALVALVLPRPFHLPRSRQEIGQASRHVDHVVVPGLQVRAIRQRSPEKAALDSGCPERLPEHDGVAKGHLLGIEAVQPPGFVLDDGAVLSEPSQPLEPEVDGLPEVVIALAGTGIRRSLAVDDVDRIGQQIVLVAKSRRSPLSHTLIAMPCLSWTELMT